VNERFIEAEVKPAFDEVMRGDLRCENAVSETRMPSKILRLNTEEQNREINSCKGWSRKLMIRAALAERLRRWEF
jgi:hypothetical protein